MEEKEIKKTCDVDKGTLFDVFDQIYIADTLVIKDSISFRRCRTIVDQIKDSIKQWHICNIKDEGCHNHERCKMYIEISMERCYLCNLEIIDSTEIVIIMPICLAKIHYSCLMKSPWRFDLIKEDHYLSKFCPVCSNPVYTSRDEITHFHPNYIILWIYNKLNHSLTKREQEEEDFGFWKSEWLPFLLSKSKRKENEILDSFQELRNTKKETTFDYVSFYMEHGIHMMDIVQLPNAPRMIFLYVTNSFPLLSKFGISYDIIKLMERDILGYVYYFNISLYSIAKMLRASPNTGMIIKKCQINARTASILGVNVHKLILEGMDKTHISSYRFSIYDWIVYMGLRVQHLALLDIRKKDVLPYGMLGKIGWNETVLKNYLGEEIDPHLKRRKHHPRKRNPYK